MRILTYNHTWFFYACGFELPLSVVFLFQNIIIFSQLLSTWHKCIAFFVKCRPNNTILYMLLYTVPTLITLGLKSQPHICWVFCTAEPHPWSLQLLPKWAEEREEIGSHNSNTLAFKGVALFVLRFPISVRSLAFNLNNLFIFKLLKYNYIITSFPFPFPPSNCAHPLFLKFMASFFWLLLLRICTL